MSPYFSVLMLERGSWFALQWRHHERNGVSNHQPDDCLLNRLFRHRSKKTSKLCVTSLREGNSPVTGEFPAQRASNAENVSIWWRHRAHGLAHMRRINSSMYIHLISYLDHKIVPSHGDAIILVHIVLLQLVPHRIVQVSCYLKQRYNIHLYKDQMVIRVFRH